MIPSIAVLMTSFNRREKTLKTLASLVAQATRMPRRLHIFLVDDASSDDTKGAVAVNFPQVQIIEGTGSLYWNGGMRLAFDYASGAGFDAYIWLNDDTELFPDAIDTLLSTHLNLRAAGVTSIVTGSTCDPITGDRTYGGMRRIMRPYRFDHIEVQPSPSEPISCDSMNGNCTLIPWEVANRLGNLEPSFQHHFGDIDYGYRARGAGFSVHVAPGFVGTCSSDLTGTWMDQSLPIRDRWKILMSPKGYRFGEWLLFVRRHYSYLWLMYFMVPYVKVLLPSRVHKVS